MIQVNTSHNGVELTCTRGDTWTLDFYYTADEVAVDITGATFRMHGRETVGGSVTVDFSSYLSIVSAGAGHFRLTVPYATTAAYTFTTLFYDVEMTLSGVRETLFGGTITNKADLSYG